MRLGITLLRALIGALFMGHGLQKLAGWFGGHGLKATAEFFESGMGMRPGIAHAGAAGVAETAGGAMLMTGVATPAAAAMLTGTMTTAVDKVHWSKGVWNQDGGFEYNVVLVAAIFAITEQDEGTAWAIAALAAGVAGGLAVSRLAQMLPAPQESSGRFTRQEEPVPTGSTAG
jgi:putative oxidoreductase